MIQKNFRCAKCSYEWPSRVDRPIYCPRCKNPRAYPITLGSSPFKSNEDQDKESKDSIKLTSPIEVDK